MRTIRTVSRSSRAKYRRLRRFIARHLTLWLVLSLLGAVLLSSVLAGAREEGAKGVAEPSQRPKKAVAAALNLKQERPQREESAPEPNLLAKEVAAPAESATLERQLNAQDQSAPFLTRQNAPDIPQCREILNQEILDIVNLASEDPAETFERNRRAHPHMIMMPPPVDCASKLWVAARRRNRAPEPPVSPELLSLRQNPIENFFNLGALNASVGTNTDLANGLGDYQGENSISIDPNNPLHMIAFSNTFYKDSTATCLSPTGGTANTYGTMALFGSTDGGATWTYHCAPWPATVTGGVTGATFWFGSDPALAWDNLGRAYACYMLISQSASASGAAIVVARSSDNGASWQSLGTVVNGIASTTQGNDKEMMAIDNTLGESFSHPGRIYVIWDAANAEKIAFSDDGAAWTTVNFPSNTGAIGGNVVVAADGAVYAIWTRYNVETIVLSKSTDGGATWSAPQVIATLALQSFGANNRPPAQDKRGINGFGAIDVDRNPNSAFFGHLYVAFPDFPSGTSTGADLNTYVIKSTNGGIAWSSRVKVNDDNFGATQIFPWLAIDQSDGTVNVSWYDSRLDPLNRQTQMVSSRSIDGGASFEPNLLVTDGGSAWTNNVNYADENSADNTTFNSNQYGDYSGIAAFNRQVHPLWTDSRMFFPLADTQSPTRREDNSTSVLTYCSAPSGIAAPAVNPSTAPGVAVSWSAPAAWGANATNGTYSVFRDTSAVFPSGSPLASDLTSTSYVDTAGVSGTTYYYFIRAKNNCSGTALTPMSTDSPASAPVEFGSSGTPTGTLQGTVTSGASPVSGVVVNAGTLSATTNASGFYLFAAINAASYTVSASPSGYNPLSISGVVVTDGGTTVQNLALTPITSGSCFTDTTFADFSSGAGSNVDIAGNPGDVKLRNLGVEATDQVSSPGSLSTTNNLSATTWTGQTFRAGVSGNLTKMNIGLGLASGSSGTITVEIRNLNGINPGTTILATTTAGPVTNVGTAALYTVTFATPAAVVSGTSYSIVLRTSVGSTVFGVRGSTAGGSTLANGQVFTTTNSGTSWTQVSADLWFTTYVTPPLTYVASGNFLSSVKDANAVVGLVPRWLTLSWNATTPANTTAQFQAAASNNVNGPFNFVGPDGTSSTFFTTSGASLSQFNGFRYLKYAALLSTTDNVITPTLNDVTVCSDTNTPAAPAITPGGPTTFCAGGSVTLTSSNATGNQWYLNGNPIGGATSQQYIATASGDYTDTVTTNGFTSAPSTAITVVVNSVPATPTITPGGPTTFCEGGDVTLTSSSASGNQWYLNGNPIGGATNQTNVATASGDYTVSVTASGCTSAPSSPTTVTVNPVPTTPTITPDGPTTFCTGGSVTLTSSSATGNQWYLNGNPIGGATNQTNVATASGDYTVTVTASGCTSASSNATTVTVNPTPSTPAITPNGPTTFCAGGSVTLTSSSASGNQWYLNGNPIGGATNQTNMATASGDYTVTVTANGCTSSPSTATTVTVNPIPATPTITPGGPTTFFVGNSVTLTSSSASGNQWHLNGNPIGGATNQTYIANASGDYTVTVTTSGCASASSAAVTVTVNPFVAAPPTISKLFLPDTVAPGETTLLSFAISNPNGDPNPDVTLNGIAFTDNLPAGLFIASPNELYNDCGGTVTASPGSSSISLSGGTLAPAAQAFRAGQFRIQAAVNPAQGTCFITVKVQAPSALGTLSNTTGRIASDESGPGATSNTASLTVKAPPVPPTIAKAFGAAGIPLNGSTSLTFTFTNPNPDLMLLNVSASDTLPAGLVVADPSSLSGTCVDFADISSNPGSNTVGMSSLSLPASSSCSFSINVTGTSAGTKNNISDNVTASFDDGVGNFVPVMGGTASATIEVLKGNQTITFDSLTNKVFGDADFSVSATASSGLSVSFTAAGNCTVTSPSPGTVHITSFGSCTITASQAGDTNYNAAADVPQSFTIANRALVTFSQSNYAVNEDTGFVTITVNRTGDLSVEFSVDYATDDTGSSDVCSTLNSGMASARCDFGLTWGTLAFAANETQKTFVVPITQDSFTEGPEVFTVNLSNLAGSSAALATPVSATVTINDSAAPAPNASDDTNAFVRQHYRDFLNREADSAGLAFWTNQIDSCGDDAVCRDHKRTNVSAAFFLSVEFQQSGLLVRNFYVAALDRPLTGNMPAFTEFERDTQAVQRGVIVGQGNWQQTLNDNRDAFMKDLVTRAEFVGLYPLTDTPTQYVDKLYLHAGVTPATPAERQAAIDEFAGAGTATDPGARGRALLDITQNTDFQQREMNRSFVQMEYFGYLRRNPNDAPDGNFVGFDFWVTKLNKFNGDYIQAGMVQAFIHSREYRQRFGP